MSRLCDWCRNPIPDGKRADASTCSKPCRQAKHRFRVSRAPAEATSRGIQERDASNGAGATGGMA
jgi:hypothetical protein